MPTHVEMGQAIDKVLGFSEERHEYNTTIAPLRDELAKLRYELKIASGQAAREEFFMNASDEDFLRDDIPEPPIDEQFVAELEEKIKITVANIREKEQQFNAKWNPDEYEY